MILKDYFDTFSQTLASISTEQVERAIAMFDEVYRHDRTIYVIGNGQSAATANAFALDFTKQTASPILQRRFRVVSLVDNLSAITAWANDVSYDAIFAEQLKSLFRAGDLLIAVSVSGNSPNIIRACEWVAAQGGNVIALVGFQGGQLGCIADTCIVVNSSDYGHVETAHIAIMHYWVDLFRERLAQ